MAHSLTRISSSCLREDGGGSVCVGGRGEWGVGGGGAAVIVVIAWWTCDSV